MKLRLIARVAVALVLASSAGLGLTAVVRAFMDAATANTGNSQAATSVKSEGTATASASGSTVTVSWPLDTLNDGTTPTTYYVLRNSGSTNTLGGGTCAGILASGTTTCKDKNVAAGTYTYSVVPNYSPTAGDVEWVGTAGTSASLTVSKSLRVSTLTAIGMTQNAQRWHATATVTVTDQTGAPVSGVTVSGAWSPTGLTASASNCGTTTNASGVCTVTTGLTDFPTTQSVETWTVSSLSATGDVYTGAENVESSVTVNQGNANVVAGNFLGSTTDITAGHTTETVTLTSTNYAPLNSTVVVLIYRESASGDSVASVSGTAISTPSLVTANAPFGGSTAYYEWAYVATGTGTSAGTVTATFSKGNAATQIDVIVLSGENTSSPVAQSNIKGSSTAMTSATATLTTPGAGDGEITLIGTVGNTTSIGTPTGWTQFEFNHNAASPAYGVGSEGTSTAVASQGFALGSSVAWGTIALEIRHS